MIGDVIGLIDLVLRTGLRPTACQGGTSRLVLGCGRCFLSSVFAFVFWPKLVEAWNPVRVQHLCSHRSDGLLVLLVLLVGVRHRVLD